LADRFALPTKRHKTHIITPVEKLANRFVLEREVGSGGMSTVYLGRDEVLRRPVAVKVLKSGFAETDIGDRFQREGKTAARLSHPNIVSVYDAGEGEVGGREVSYIVMEYMPGGDLKDLLDERGPLEKKELSRIGAEAAAGLAHAHDRGIVHRDIKPHNILLDAAGHPKLTDFGIARALEATRFTQTGSYLGTALYSSPEQLRGQNVTVKSDVYSLGATLYQAAVGSAPFQGSAMEVAEKHLSKEPKPPGELRPGIDEALASLILSCLAKDPDERPSSREIETRLGEMSVMASSPRVAAAPNGRSRTGPEERSSGPSRRRRPLGVVAAIAVVAVLALAGIALAPSLFDGNGTEESASQQNAPQENAPQQNSSQEGASQTPQTDEAAPSDASGGVNEGQSGEAPAEPAPSEPDPVEPSRSEPDPDEADPGEQSPEEPSGGLSEEEAAETVEGFYTTAADEEYGRSSEYLSTEYRQARFSNEGIFEGTFATLESISFVEEPEVEISGDTATVTGVTEAVHTDRTERNTATWTLVDEGGEWKLDDIAIQNQEIV
jgi:eukaryotic-like serine/threonine-protein kinase